MRLANRRILITGAASGIGRATAELFAAEGASIALLDRDAEGLKDVASKTGCPAFVADLQYENSVKTAIEAAVEALSGLDGLVHVAGIFQPGKFGDTSIATWRRMIDINLTGAFLVSHFALPWLQASGKATIVNVASGQALLPSPISAAYGTSKAGVAMLSKFMAQELGPNIRVNAIAPGIIDTPMAKNLMSGLDQPAQEDMLRPYAMKRMGQPHEVARLLLFLTSDESSFITGDVIAVDGGRSYH